MRLSGRATSVRTVVDGFVGFGLGEVGDGDLVADAGGLLIEVRERGLAGEQGLLRVQSAGGKRQGGSEQAGR